MFRYIRDVFVAQLQLEELASSRAAVNSAARAYACRSQMSRRSSWRKEPYNNNAVPLPQPRPQGLDNDSHVWGGSESEDDDLECPLCLEPMDETDRTFYPCPCGYQLCLYCFNRVKDKNDKCPACRSKYCTDNYKYVQPDTDSDAAATRRRQSEPHQELDEAQLDQLQAMSEARARAMEAQARRCGACQVEGPPLEPDPRFDNQAAQQAASRGSAEPEPSPAGNTWASLASGRSAPTWPGAPAAVGNGDPWRNQSWPSLGDPTQPAQGSQSMMGDLAVDDWEQLAEELVQETSGFETNVNNFGSRASMYKEQMHKEREASRLQQSAMQQQQDDTAHRQLDEELARLQQEIASAEGHLSSAKEQLQQEDQMYDMYQEKSAELRLQQEGWDRGVMDLLSKWQSWTDAAEREEAAHLDEESVLMAKLLSHQQQMAEMLSALPSSLAPASEEPKQSVNSTVWGAEPTPFSHQDQQHGSFGIPSANDSVGGVWGGNKAASKAPSWEMGRPASNESDHVRSVPRVPGWESSAPSIASEQQQGGWAVAGPGGASAPWGGSSVQPPPGMAAPGMQIGHRIGGGNGWGSTTAVPLRNDSASQRGVWDGPSTTNTSNSTWGAAGSENTQQGVQSGVWGSSTGMGGGMW